MKALLLAALLALPAAAQVAVPLDRTAPVAPAAPRPFQLPPLSESNLPNGMKVALIEVHRVALVSVRLVFPFAGSANDPSGKAGLAGLTASLMTEGAGALDGRAFAEAVDDLGASVSASADKDALVVTVFAAKENLDAALALAASMVRTPALPEADFERNRAERLAGLEAEKGSPGGQAERRLQTLVLGGHPYGTRADETSLTALSPADARTFHALRVRPEGAVFAAAGDIDMAGLTALAQKHFGTWTGAPTLVPLAETPRLAERDPSSTGGLVIDLIDVPGAQQSALRLGHRSVSRDDSDYLAVSLMNFILGRAPITNRLEHNIREVHSWAYGASSGVDAWRRGGMFSVETDVQTDATADALREVLKEMSRMQTELVPDAELASAKRLLAGLFVMRQQKVQDIAAQAAGIELNGLSPDTLQTYRDRVAALTAADVQAAALKHLRPAELRIVVAGDAKLVKGPLSAVAPVRVLGADGNPPAPAPAAR
ncbi:insulinase family protein [bacterium]|nr:MAG: insulinase family protein [bacterium]